MPAQDSLQTVPMACRPAVLLANLPFRRHSAAVAHGGGTPRLTNAEAGPYRVYAWSEPDPLLAGDVHLSVVLTVPAESRPADPTQRSGTQVEEPVTDAEGGCHVPPCRRSRAGLFGASHAGTSSMRSITIPNWSCQRMAIGKSPSPPMARLAHGSTEFALPRVAGPSCELDPDYRRRDHVCHSPRPDHSVVTHAVAHCRLEQTRRAMPDRRQVHG